MKKNKLPLLFLLAGAAGISAFLTGCDNSVNTGGGAADSDIKSVSVSFYERYNYSTGEAINQAGEVSVPKYTLSLSDEQLEKFKKAFSEKKKYKDDTDCAYLDEYFLLVNDKDEYYCNYEDTVWTESPYTVYKSDELISLISGIADEYLTENVYLHTLDCGVDSIIRNGEWIEMSDEISSTVSEYKLSKIDIKEDFNSYGTIEYVITLKDNNVLLLYKDKDNTGYVDSKDGGYYVSVTSPGTLSLSEYLSNIKNNAEKNSGAAENAKVTVSYKNKSVEADEELAAEIIKQSASMEYSQFGWLTKDYDMGECVEVNIENGVFYIPVDEVTGNRYYKDEKGEIYFVMPFANGAEDSVFELAGIKR